MFGCLMQLAVFAQPTTVSGRIFDVTRKNYVEAATVYSTNGQSQLSDSLGQYRIEAGPADSLYFMYAEKPTQKFAVKDIPNTSQFDVSLKILVPSRFSTLQEVVVYTKSFQQDSLENRESYRKIFGYSKPGLSTSVNSDGAVGADVNEIINAFRFKRNKRLKAFRKRLEQQEMDNYVNYRFNAKMVHRITQMDGADLDSFMVWYRPPYDFTASASEIQFNQYVLNAFYHYRRIHPLPTPAKKEDE